MSQDSLATLPIWIKDEILKAVYICYTHSSLIANLGKQWGFSEDSYDQSKKTVCSFGVQFGAGFEFGVHFIF